MTLVVANATSKPFMIGDARVVRDDRANLNLALHPHALKVVIVGRGIVVGFAGTVHTAYAALKNLSQGVGADQIVAELLAHHLGCSCHTDFLVLDHERGVCTIEHGTASAWRPVGHVGDHQAFARYQTAFHEAVAAAEEESRRHPRSAASPALTNACELSSDLGGFEIFATLGRNGFEYYSQVLSVGMAPTPNSTVLRRQTAAEGGCALLVLPPSDPGVGALGTHIEQGRLGVFHYPAALDEPVTFGDCGVHDFVRGVKAEFGVDLRVDVELG